MRLLNRRVLHVKEGKAMEIVNAINAAWQERQERFKILMEKTGAESGFGKGKPEILLYQAEGDLPEEIDGVPFHKVLRKKKMLSGEMRGKKCFVPHHKTSAGKALRVEIDALDFKVNERAVPMFREGDPIYLAVEEATSPGVPVYYPQVWNEKDIWFVSVHRKCNALPVEGLIPLSLSEYYKMIGE